MSIRGRSLSFKLSWGARRQKAWKKYQHLKSTSRSDTTKAAPPHSDKFCTFCLRCYACSQGCNPFRKGKNLSSSDMSFMLCRALARKSAFCSPGLIWSVSDSSRNDVPSTTHYQVRKELSLQLSLQLLPGSDRALPYADLLRYLPTCGTPSPSRVSLPATPHVHYWPMRDEIKEAVWNIPYISRSRRVAFLVIRYMLIGGFLQCL